MSHTAPHPRCTLHVRIQRCAGLRSSADGRSDAIDAFVVAQLHPHATPDLASLRSAPPPTAASATSQRSRTRSGGVAAFQFDAQLPFTHASDCVSLAVCDAATPAAAAAGSSSAASLRRILGAVCIPIHEVLDHSCVDRWFDLSPPSHASASASAGLPEVKPADAIIAVAPDALDNPHAHTSPLGRVRVQMFAVGPGCPVPAWKGGVAGSLAFPEDSSPVGLHVVTWNVGNAPLPDDMRALLPVSCFPSSAAPQEEMPALIAIGLQECAYTPVERDLAGVPLAASLESSVIAAFTRLIPAAYTRVHAHALGEMRLLLFVLSDWRSDLSSLTLDAVPCGIGNVIANKGMILCSFRLRDTSIALVTGHLAAHTDKLAQRNKDLALVARAVSYSFDSAPLFGASAPPSASASSDFLSSFHSVFLFGDLNYRLEFPRGNADRSPSTAAFQQVVGLVRQQAWATLWGFDQLRMVQARGEALVGFRESAPAFAPSFKVLRNVALGYNAKRIPSWCDRILYKSVFNEADDATAQPPSDSASVIQRSLRLVSSLCSSDHKPVAASFLVRAFWKSGCIDHALGRAEMELSSWKTDAAALTSLLGQESSSAGVVELRAAFLADPILLPLSSLSSIAFPLTFNNPLRIRRELVLVRLFKSSAALITGAGGNGVAASTTPLARGLCVIDCGSVPLAADASSKRVTLSVQMLRPGGALALTLQTVVTLRWQPTKGSMLASPIASEAAGPASSPSASSSKVQVARTLAALAASDGDDDLFDDDEDALLSPASFALSAQLRPKQPAVAKASARLPSSSPTSRSKAVSASTIKAAPFSLASGSTAQPLRPERALVGATPVVPKTIALPTHVSKSLLLLVGVFASSEGAYVKALGHLHRSYHLPLVRLASSVRVDFSSASTPSALHVSNLCGSSLPLLLDVHSRFAGALEAQLQQLAFGSSPTASPVEALRVLAQLLTQLLPFLALYHSASLSAGAAAWLNEDAAKSPDSLRAQARALITQVDSAARSSALTFDALVSLVAQRVGSYHLWLHELLHVLERLSALAPLASTYAELLAGFDRLEAQSKAFSEWYPSLALQRAQGDEDALYASLAGETAPAAAASSSSALSMLAVADGKGLRDSMAMMSFPVAPQMRPSTAAVLHRPGSVAQWRDHSALELPRPATGCRLATSFDPDASGSSATTYMLASKVASQLRTRTTLAGFHPYLRSHRTQEDFSLDSRADAPKARQSKFGPTRARALSVGSLDMFRFAPSLKWSGRGMLSSDPVVRPNSADWSLQRACATLGIGTAAAPAAAHWSSRLPKSFRTLQAGRSMLALVDMQSAFTPASAAPASAAGAAASSRRPSPPPAATAPAPSPVSAREFAMDAADEASLYDDDFLELGAEDDSKLASSTQSRPTPSSVAAPQNTRASIADDHIDPAMSMGSEMIQKVLAASAAAHRGPTMAARRVSPAQPTPAATSSRPSAAAASTASSAAAAPIAPPSSRRPVGAMPRPTSALRHGGAASSASNAAPVVPSSPRTSATAAAASRPAPSTRPGGAGIVRQPTNPLTLSTAFRSAAISSAPSHLKSEEPEPAFQLKPRTRPAR